MSTTHPFPTKLQSQQCEFFFTYFVDQYLAIVVTSLLLLKMLIQILSIVGDE